MKKLVVSVLIAFAAIVSANACPSTMCARDTTEIVPIFGGGIGVGGVVED